MRKNYRFQLLAPSQSPAHGNFGRSKVNEQLHRQYLHEVQRLRGRVYLKDGAIQACELQDDGRFHMRHDEQCWHLLLIDEAGQVIGCARYLVHPGNVLFDRLRISQSALAKDKFWGPHVRAAVEADLNEARRQGFSYLEIGGWALSEEWRGTRAALEILVGSYALSHLWGGCIAACTATVRHSSSSMLRRIGGLSFKTAEVELPRYDDSQYGCKMELLRFDCRAPSPRFGPLIAQLKVQLADSVTITPGPVRDWLRLPQELGSLALLRMAPLSL
jgi:predicted GNAT family N-acyltransferase